MDAVKVEKATPVAAYRRALWDTRSLF